MIELLFAAAIVAGETAPPPPSPPTPPAAEVPWESPEFPFGPDAADAARTRVHQKIAIGTELTVAADELVLDQVVCVGCEGSIDGVVRGDVVIVGGTVEMKGTVYGDVVAVGSRVTMADTARVRQDLVNVLGKVNRGGARIEGAIDDYGLGGLFVPTGAGIRGLAFATLPWDAIVLVVTLAGALALAAILPDRIERIVAAASSRTFGAVFAGIAGYVLFAMLFLVLFVTVLGIPVAVLVWCVFTVFKWMGLASLFLATGRRLGRSAGRAPSLPAAVVLGFLPFALLRLVPFLVGNVLWFAVEIVAIGWVIVSRAGKPRPAAV